LPTPALFVDRDGTLNEMVYDDTHGLFDSPRRPEQVRLRPGAAEFLRAAREAGLEIVVVTNQPGLARGSLTPEQLEAVHKRLAGLLAAGGARWDAVYVCPHHPSVAGCDCRKPRPGLLLRAARERGLDLTRSWMVGDGLVDVGAGRAAGCRTVLVTRLKLEQIERFLSFDGAEPDLIVPSLAEAAAAMWGRTP